MLQALFPFYHCRKACKYDIIHEQSFKDLPEPLESL